MKDEGIPFLDDLDDLPWSPEDSGHEDNPEKTHHYGEDVHGQLWEPIFTINEVSQLLDQMIMDIQHLPFGGIDLIGHVGHRGAVLLGLQARHGKRLRAGSGSL